MGEVDRLNDEIEELREALEAAERTARRQQEKIDTLLAREARSSIANSDELGHVTDFIRCLALMCCGDCNAISLSITLNK